MARYSTKIHIGGAQAQASAQDLDANGQQTHQWHRQKAKAAKAGGHHQETLEYGDMDPHTYSNGGKLPHDRRGA